MKHITREDTKKRLTAGVNKLADIVRVTLGGKGKNVIIKKAVFNQVSIINDGVSIAREIELEDEIENTGADLAKIAANKTNEEAGDGTTTTIVLLQSYLREMMKLETPDQRGLRDEIKAKIEELIVQIDSKKRKIKGQDLLKVAKNSALDDDIAQAVVEVVNKVGKDGIVSIEESATPGIHSEVVDGISINDGYLTPYFINNNSNGKAEFKNTAVILVNKHIKTIHEILKLMEEMMKKGQTSAVIFVKQIADEVAGFLVANKIKGTFQSCVIKTIDLEELETITGAKIISDDNNFGFTMDSLGFAGSVTVSKRDTVVSADKNRKKQISTKIEEMKNQMEVSTNDSDKAKFKQRISKLENGIATIRIGGNNDQETKEKKYKLEDAMNSVMSAIDDGVVEGGGMTLYRLSEEITGTSQADVLIKEVLRAPFKQIVENGEDEFRKVILGYTPTKGYNVISREWEDLFKSGVIDPAKVVKSALKNAFYMGNQILTVEAGIIEERPKGDIQIS
jgi:chaperonin GroEL